MLESPLVPILSMALVFGVALGLRNFLEPSRKAELEDQSVESDQHRAA
jgi:hypothetical protein